MRHALGEPARVHEDERGAVRLDELDEPVVDLLPHLVRHHRLERRAGHFDREVDLALVAAVDDRARRPFAWMPRRETARPPRSASASPTGRCAGAPAADMVEALEREREVGAAPRLQHRVDLVDDHHARGAQHRCASAPR